jgi:hypothetical protein
MYGRAKENPREICIIQIEDPVLHQLSTLGHPSRNESLLSHQEVVRLLVPGSEYITWFFFWIGLTRPGGLPRQKFTKLTNSPTSPSLIQGSPKH